MSSSGSKSNSSATMYRGRIAKVGTLVFFSMLLMAVYVNFFQHPPPEELLKQNRKALLSSKTHDFGASLFGSSDDKQMGEDDVDDEDDDDDGDDIFKEEKDNDLGDDDNNGDDGDDEVGDKNKKDDIISHKKRELGASSEIEMAGYWEKFLKDRNLVPIGAVYSKCDGPRVQLGTVTLMEDKVNGGIMARTYVNITLKSTVDGGQFNIDSKYNGRSLYDNYWELCEVEDDVPDEEKTFTCPLKPGSYTRVKDKAIPSFLPKGRFQSKIWATDQDGHMIGCGYSDFTI